MTDSAQQHLRKDPIFAKLLDRLPAPPQWYGTGDHFSDLIEIVTNQQLSYYAGKKIFARFQELFKNIPLTPQSLLQVGDETLRSVGYSRPKVIYLKNIAAAINDHSLDLALLPLKTDQEVQQEITKIKGLGPWSAQMFLIFSLNRPDIFSIGDIGLRTAVSRLYGLDRNDLVAIEKIADYWSPFRSIACRYLWQSLEKV